MTPPIPYHIPHDLGKQKFALMQEIHEILKSKVYTKGPHLQELSAMAARLTGYEYAIPFAQCTHAIFVLAAWYKSLGCRGVWAPRFTWRSTYEPFEWLGYDVHFVDIDPDTWLAQFGDRVYDEDELVCPVDTFGSVFHTEDIPETGHTPWVDSAQSLGAQWDSTEPHRVVSLSGSKSVTAGEGGLLLTQEKRLADFSESVRAWFSRMPEMSAILGNAYLGSMRAILEKKREIAEAYRRRLPDLKWQIIPHVTSHYIIAAEVDDRSKVIRDNPHMEFRTYYNVEDSNLPVTDRLSKRIIAFPSWPDMPLEVVDDIRI